MEKKSVLLNISAIVITIIVITTIFLSGPASAFNLQLTNSKNNVYKNEKVDFIASVKIDSNEFLNVSYIILKLNGPINVQCRFLVNGTAISGCNGMSIKQISSTAYGYSYNYGYGYTNGELKYNITLDTTNYPVGVYKTYLLINSNGADSEQSGNDIVITKMLELKDCSIRAKDSVLNVENSDFGKNNKLNFYVPFSNAAPGEGFLIGQKDKTTFSYKFKVKQRALENNNNTLIVLVSGTYRIGLGKAKLENSTIIFDKKKNKISVTGNNINIQNMAVYFRQGPC